MYDYLVVGAGPSGLCAAKTILECEPDADIKILDANNTLGGVWSKENIYPGLKTNNLRGGIDFSDFPMHDGFGIPQGQHPTGEAMHNYLEAYADRADVVRLIDFDIKVTEISPLEDDKGWRLKTALADHEYKTKKLIVATGITNHPHRPTLQGADGFGGPIIHSAELGFKGDAVFNNPKVTTIAVLGGGKSAYDAVHLAGKTGRQVEWIIRKSGKGPEWIFPSHTKMGPFSVPREWLTTRRILSFFSPCLWNDGFSKFRSFLHQTSIGMSIAQKFWANLHAATVKDCGMRLHESTRVLEPQTSPFWYGTASGIYNFEKDIYEMVKMGQVRVHREDISHLSAGHIHLTSSKGVDASALITATGFSAKPTFTFTRKETHSDLGVPSTSLTPVQQDFWNALDEKADLRIGEAFPRLLSGPHLSATSSVVKLYTTTIDPEMNYSPFRLYRAIAPPGPTARGDHSLVFISMFSNLANTARCELQCLWVYAYLNDKLAIERATVFEETALMARYAKFRAPFGHGRFFPDLVFDQVPYFDTLLQDLGLKFWRKPHILAELFGAYRSTDYNGVVQEWSRANMAPRLRSGEKEPLLNVNGGANA
ncbi:dimethylaniline monooxygenase (N-oxide forming) [Exophiala viscosa]|uniref:Dimethylaniline monooxygenase (N-oxide forming) n=1 Tax=Exophiala viscosa TaxID=2486360 RepID=A0AAN6I9T6_9EURO|nr:dimethylaniline monooxygenase (N-oxide forming) [Exophiala viscosa]KAI1620987.1 dimethylaniline monooxygenase (N-oxide forming) [Exophiala viscosa]